MKCPFLKTTHYKYNPNNETPIYTYEEFRDCTEERCDFYRLSPMGKWICCHAQYIVARK